MSTWWVARKSMRGFVPEIRTVEVAKATENQVVFPNGRRCNKRSSYENYFEHWDNAYAFLLSNAELRLEQVKIELHRAQSSLGQIKSMKRPEVTE